jgi:mannose-6-phosphate isomerase-like protein (cupin superfamily)
MYIKKIKKGVLLSKKTSVNLELGVVSRKKGKFTKLGLHKDEEEVYIILKGKGILTLGDQQKVVKAGYIVYVPIGVKHQFKSLSDNFTYIYVATWPK